MSIWNEIKTWGDLYRLFPNVPSDGHNEKTLKHLYRCGVAYGLIDPDSEKSKDLWSEIARESELS